MQLVVSIDFYKCMYVWINSSHCCTIGTSSRLGLPYVRFFPDMSGILVAKYESGRNVKKCLNVRDFEIMPFMKYNHNVFTVRIAKC